MDLTAYALRAEYEGTTDVTLEDGATETRPTFGGGLLAVGDGDFDVAAELQAGDGVIVVHRDDAQLVELLDAYPALKHVGIPRDPTPVSRYKRRTTDALRFDAGMRGLHNHASLGRERLIAGLEAFDEHNGDLDAANAAAETHDDTQED
jgi:hypothetical protein